jgi:glyoxylase-like metal-dependent hydrolase (beta-lactamase superfamily II)
LHIGEQNPLDASADYDFAPDEVLEHGQVIHGKDWTIEAVYTPGHTANHMAFAMGGNGVLFSADHVMAWATSIVAPPDGAMVDYMASLDTLLQREDKIYYPGHGGPVVKPHIFVRALRTHRKMRERAVLERIRKGDRLIPAMVKVIYRETDPRLHGAAALSVMAHIEDLVERGLVTTSGPVAIDGEFETL